jgi:plastocyanin
MKKLLLFLAVFCSVATASTATIYTVMVSDFSFNPAAVTAHVGDTVRWVWLNGTHTTTSNNIPTGATSWDAPITSAANIFSYKLAQAGTYNYVCTPHAPGMAGVINVTSSASVPNAAPVALFRIVPNASSSSLHIELSSTGNTTVSIVDASGRLIKSGNYSGAKTIDLSTVDLANGVYIIRAATAGQSYAQTVEITH